MRQKFAILSSSVLVSTFVLVSCGGGQEQTSMTEEETVGPNQLTQAEIEDGWVSLFDGTTPAGWTGYKKETFPGGWQIDDGTLFCMGSGRGEAGAPKAETSSTRSHSRIFI